MDNLISGTKVASLLQQEIERETQDLFNLTGKRPNLTVIIVGNNPASLAYVKNKHKFATLVGFDSNTITLPVDILESELLEQVVALNNDDRVNGILVQLPLPKHINEQNVIRAINPLKDVDGFHPEQVGNLSIGIDSFTLKPCTPSGIITLLNSHDIKIDGSHAVIIGRSNIVGKPIANMLLSLDATVSICHSKTPNLKDFTKNADILIVAIGKSKFVTADMIKDGAVVIDVGINRGEDGLLVGDVDFENVKGKAAFITPVPGGVGPMTIAMLMKNTLQAFKNQLI